MIYQTDLVGGLQLFANESGLNRDELTDYANEENIGGFGQDVHGTVVDINNWPVGSMWGVEGRFLYALIRAMKPANVLEIGVSYGCSSTHILSALERNADGTLTSLDVVPDVGQGIPDGLRPRWTFIRTDAIDWCEQHHDHFDIVFEDAAHTQGFTRQVLSAVKANLSPRLVISHDAAHFGVGESVRNGFLMAMGKITVVLMEPSDCGFGWWIA